MQWNSSTWGRADKAFTANQHREANRRMHPQDSVHTPAPCIFATLVPATLSRYIIASTYRNGLPIVQCNMPPEEFHDLGGSWATFAHAGQTTDDRQSLSRMCFSSVTLIHGQVRVFSPSPTGYVHNKSDLHRKSCRIHYGIRLGLLHSTYRR